MTGWSTIELAVEAMRHGACDFIPKPWDNRHFLSVIEKNLNAPSKIAKPLDGDLAIARKVQRKLLPEPRFNALGLVCECASVPANDVGGDLYDFFQSGPDRLSFLVGDVSGKGIAAALLVANLQATIRAQCELTCDPAKLMQRVNALFFGSTRPEHYATLFFAVYDSATRGLRYANCGHPPPVLVRGDGNLQLLEPTGTVLGAFQNRPFEECAVDLREGDQLVLYSDGFSECALAGDEDDWAVRTIRSLASENLPGLAGQLASLAASTGKPSDDITIMVVQLARDGDAGTVKSEL